MIFQSGQASASGIVGTIIEAMRNSTSSWAGFSKLKRIGSWCHMGFIYESPGLYFYCKGKLYNGGSPESI